MSNYEKYLKYKLKYQIIQLGGSHDDLVFITGIPGSGKSTVIKEFVKQDFVPISLDPVVEFELTSFLTTYNNILESKIYKTKYI